MNSSFYGTSSYNMDEYDNDDEHGRTATAVLTAVDKSIQKWKQVNELFKKNECENSLYLLSQVNAFRIFCMKIISSKPFDVFILILILLSTLRLILGTIINGYQFVFIFDIIDLCFNIIFTIIFITPQESNISKFKYTVPFQKEHKKNYSSKIVSIKY